MPNERKQTEKNAYCYVSIYSKCLKKPDVQRPKIDHCLPGSGLKGNLEPKATRERRTNKTES